MPEQKPIEIKFPKGGVHRGLAFADQPPNTCVDAKNVRPEGNIAKRDRGGARPGLRKAFPDGLGAISRGTIDTVVFSSATGRTTWTAANIATETVTGELQTAGRSKLTVAATGPFTGSSVTGVTVGWTVEFDIAGTQFVIDEIVDTENVWVIGDTSVAFAAGTAITVGPFRSEMIGRTARDDTTDNAYVIFSYTSVSVVVVEGDASNESSSFNVGGSPVRCLSSVNRAIAAAPQTLLFHESFDPLQGVDPGDAWTTATHVGVDGRPILLFGGLIPAGDGEYSIVHDFLGSPQIDLGSTYIIKVRYTPRAITTDTLCFLHIFAGLANVSHNVLQDGYHIQIEPDENDEWTRVRLDQYIAGVKVPATPRVRFNTQYPEWPPVEIEVEFDSDGKTIKIRFNGSEIIDHTFAAVLGSGSGSRFGVGTETDTRGINSGFPRVDDFQVLYTSFQRVQGTTRNQLVAISGGDLWRNLSSFQITRLSSDLTFAKDRLIIASEHLQKLYFADWGDVVANGALATLAATNTLDHSSYSDWTTLGLNTNDFLVELTVVSGTAVAGIYPISSISANTLTLGKRNGDTIDACPSSTGTATFRIVRGIKIYDTSLGTQLYLADASVGLGFPVGCKIIAMFQDRIWLAGDVDSPQVWFVSARGDPSDWNFADDPANPAKATSGQVGEIGSIGDDITALAPMSRDYMVVGGRSSVSVLRGDPGLQGRFDSLSRNIGIVDRGAWCVTPEGGLLFMSAEGLYYISPGAETIIQQVSEEILPNALSSIDPQNTEVLMEFDTHFHGAHIYLSPKSLANYTLEVLPARVHYWFSWKNKSLWPVVLPQSFQPMSIHSYSPSNAGERRVMHGSNDGYLRSYQDRMDNDDDTLVASEITFGPFDLRNGDRGSIVTAINAELADTSNNVTWELYVAKTPEQAAKNSLIGTSPDATGTWISGGINFENHPRIFGGGMCIKIKSLAAGNAQLGGWALESLNTKVAPGGVIRK